MPRSQRDHIKIDQETLKKPRANNKTLIPKDFDTSKIHEFMDMGTDELGPLHRAIDTWHDVEWVARHGLSLSNKGKIQKRDLDEYFITFRVAKVHLVSDAYESWYKLRYKVKTVPLKKIIKYINGKLNDRIIRERYFTPNKTTI